MEALGAVGANSIASRVAQGAVFTGCVIIGFATVAALGALIRNQSGPQAEIAGSV
jgi:hypothetical protein